MEVILLIRQDMLEIMRTAFNALSPNTDPKYKKIRFLDSGNNPLCDMPFDDFELKPSGDDATYRFKAIDGSYVLQAGASAAGTASKFEIWGDRGDGPETIILGTVGTGTNVDIRFNSVNWSDETFNTLTELSIRIKQGS